MQKIFFQTIALLILLTATSGNAFCQAVMTMTTDPNTKEVKITLFGSGTVTIDWGDGKNDNFEISDSISYYNHTYSDSFVRTITIIGENIIFMDCRWNKLISLDVSKNLSLKRLACPSNQLTSLDVSKNTALEGLYCGDNKLTNLDVSKNTTLKALSCFSNKLKNLDVSNNTELIHLSCSWNQLENLDISKNVKLVELYCGINNLTHLNVSENTVLQGLHCVSNNFSETALNALFETLHNIIFEDCGKIIFIDGNQGTNQCDKTIAEKKGWEVIFCIDKPKNHTKSKQSNKSKFRQKNR